MKTGPSLLSIALLLALVACSKQPQDAAPSSTPAPVSALATPASDPSLPSASVVVNAPGTPLDPPASAPAGMLSPSATLGAASAPKAP